MDIIRRRVWADYYNRERAWLEEQIRWYDDQIAFYLSMTKQAEQDNQQLIVTQVLATQAANTDAQIIDLKAQEEVSTDDDEDVYIVNNTK